MKLSQRNRRITHNSIFAFSHSLTSTFSGSPGAHRVVEPSELNSQRNTFDFFPRAGQQSRLHPRRPNRSPGLAGPLNRARFDTTTSASVVNKVFSTFLSTAGLTSTGLPLSWRVLIFACFEPPSNRNFHFFSTLTVSGKWLVSSRPAPYFSSRKRQQTF